MKTWFVSDTHFYHRNIIRYSDRPFENVHQMNETMIDNWNKHIAPEDFVYFLGDFAFCGKKWAAELFTRLNGTKVLIKGNHDGNTQKMLDIGFKEVYNSLELEIAGEKVLLCHYPYLGDETAERKRLGEQGRNEQYIEKFVESRPRDEGGWLIHGHVHNYWKLRGKMINVSVEMWDYSPVSLETIEEIIRGGANERIEKSN